MATMKRMLLVAAVTFGLLFAWAGAYYAGIHWVPGALDSFRPMGDFNGPSEPLRPQPLPGFWGKLPAEEQSTVVARVSGPGTRGDVERFLFFTATVEDPLRSPFQRAQKFEFAVHDPAAETVLLRDDFAAVEITVSQSIPADWKARAKDLSDFQDDLLFLVSVDNVIRHP